MEEEYDDTFVMLDICEPADSCYHFRYCAEEGLVLYNQDQKFLISGRVTCSRCGVVLGATCYRCRDRVKCLMSNRENCLRVSELSEIELSEVCEECAKVIGKGL